VFGQNNTDKSAECGKMRLISGEMLDSTSAPVAEMPQGSRNQ
jgi:hypothetical protein